MSFLEAASSSTARWMRPFELAEPLLSRHQVGTAGLEDFPALAFEASRQQPQKRRLAHAVVAADEQRSRRRLQASRLGGRQGLAPHLGLDQQFQLLAIRPEATERGEEGAIDAGALESVELPDQRRGVGVVDPLQEGLDRARRRGIGRLQRRAESGPIAQSFPLDEVVAEKPRQDDVLGPPILGARHRRPDRRARLDDGEIREREVHRPGVELVEVRHDIVDGLVAVGAPDQRRQGRARQGPVGAGHVLHHRVEGHVRALQQPHSLHEIALLLELARVGVARRQRRE